ncbi:hypothetical protein BGZ90_001859 [Linnemannia elongata]|nr:hypothetical protein BGZ90_001859 [Linnemannia elongata]
MKLLALTTTALMAIVAVTAAPLPGAEGPSTTVVTAVAAPLPRAEIDFAPPNIIPHIGQESQDDMSNRNAVQKRDIPSRGWKTGVISMTSHGAGKWKVLDFNTFGKSLVDTMVKAWKQNSYYGGHTIHVDADSSVYVEWNMPLLTDLSEGSVKQMSLAVVDTQRQFQWQTAEFLWTIPSGDMNPPVGTMSIHRV